MHFKTTVSRLLTGSAIALTAGLSGTAALAQDAEGGYGGGEIIVTAQKREQSVQDVPIAISALGEDTLQANRITSGENLTGLAPGLVTRVSPGGSRAAAFAMRGVSTSAAAPTQDRSIPIYLDGVYLGGVRGTLVDYADLQRVEVLRGPQGTLFGRNATAGAVSFITRDPTGELGYIQELTVGNYDQFRSRTTVDLPQTGPLSAYVTYVHEERRGDVRNLGGGTQWNRVNPFNNKGIATSPNWLGGKNNESVMGAVKFDNGGSLTATYKLDWSKGKASQAIPIVVISPYSTTGALLLGMIARQPEGGGRYGEVVLTPQNRRPKATNNASSVPSSTNVLGHNLTLDWQASDDISIKSITSYRKIRSFGPVTIDGVDGLEYTAAAKEFYNAPQASLGGASYASIFTGGPDDSPIGSYFTSYNGNAASRYYQWSQEVYGTYSTDRLNLTAGAMYFYSKSDDGALEGFVNNYQWRPLPSLLPLGNTYDDDGTTKSMAAYMQVEYKLTDQFTVIAGGRITKEEKWSRLTRGGTFVGDRYVQGGGEIVGTRVSGEGRFKKTKPTYSVGVNYEPNDDILLYAKYSTAFLSGGATGQFNFSPETAKSAEVGIKSDLLDRKVRLNLTGWWVKYNNSQASLSGRAVEGGGDLGVVVLNIGDVTAKGIELDLGLFPVEGLSLGGTVGYTDDKIKNADVRFSNNRPIDRTSTPTWVGSAYAQYETQPIAGNATLSFRADARFESKSRAFAYTDMDTFLDSRGRPTSAPFVPYEFIPSKVVVNGRIALKGIEFNGTDLELAVWSKNLFDNKKGVYPFDFGQGAYVGGFEPARTFGVDLIVKFNH